MLTYTSGHNMKVESKVKKKVYNKVIDGLWQSGTATPHALLLLYNAEPSGTFSAKGPQPDFNYTYDQFVDGVNIGKVPAVQPGGVFDGGYFKNIFAGQPTAPEAVLLTAQDYVLQVFGGGSASSSYGVATVGSPLEFTAIAGSTTFTPTDGEEWMLTEGPYVWPYIPPQSDTAGAGGANEGLSWLMNDAMLDAFEGLGPEIVKNGTFDNNTDFWRPGSGATLSSVDGECNIQNPAGDAFGGAYQQLSTTSGDIHVITFDVTFVSALASMSIVDSDLNELGLVVGSYKFYFTPTSTTPDLRAGSNGVAALTKFDNISVKKLIPSPMTIATVVTVGAGSDELVNGDSFNLISSSDEAAAPLSFGKDGTGSYFVIYDGVTLSKVYTAWDRDDEMLISGQVLTDGTQMRVGYMNITQSEVAITYNTPDDFFGTFNPALSMINAYLKTTPGNLQQVQLWNIQAADADIIKLVI